MTTYASGPAGGGQSNTKWMTGDRQAKKGGEIMAHTKKQATHGGRQEVSYGSITYTPPPKNQANILWTTKG